MSKRTWIIIGIVVLVVVIVIMIIYFYNKNKKKSELKREEPENIASDSQEKEPDIQKDEPIFVMSE